MASGEKTRLVSVGDNRRYQAEQERGITNPILPLDNAEINGTTGEYPIKDNTNLTPGSKINPPGGQYSLNADTAGTSEECPPIKGNPDFSPKGKVFLFFLNYDSVFQ